MERLTEWRDGHGALIRGDGYTKLAQYEDIGLDPEEIRELTRSGLEHIAKMHCDWMIANSEKRLIILPCKQGDTAFCINDDGELCEGKVYRIFYEVYLGQAITALFVDTTTGIIYAEVDDVGRTVFFTREEAEDAMKKEEA